MQQDDQLQNIIDLIQKTGDKAIVLEKGRPAYVLMRLKDYEGLVLGKSEVRGLTEDELLDKMNREIAVWKDDQEKVKELEEEYGNNDIFDSDLGGVPDMVDKSWMRDPLPPMSEPMEDLYSDEPLGNGFDNDGEEDFVDFIKKEDSTDVDLPPIFDDSPRVEPDVDHILDDDDKFDVDAEMKKHNFDSSPSSFRSGSNLGFSALDTQAKKPLLPDSAADRFEENKYYVEPVD